MSFKYAQRLLKERHDTNLITSFPRGITSRTLRSVHRFYCCSLPEYNQREVRANLRKLASCTRRLNRRRISSVSQKDGI